jgi:hypothetical protein
MTMHEPNPDVQPTGEEAGEFIEDTPEERQALKETDPDGPRPADWRMYTGEPLETEDGVYRPQMNVGKDNVAGGGEWPDPHTKPQEPAPGAVERIDHSENRDATES